MLQFEKNNNYVRSAQDTYVAEKTYFEKIASIISKF